jgi:hypothetical protein
VPTARCGRQESESPVRWGGTQADSGTDNHEIFGLRFDIQGPSTTVTSSTMTAVQCSCRPATSRTTTSTSPRPRASTRSMSASPTKPRRTPPESALRTLRLRFRTRFRTRSLRSGSTPSTRTTTPPRDDLQGRDRRQPRWLDFPRVTRLGGALLRPLRGRRSLVVVASGPGCPIFHGAGSLSFGAVVKQDGRPDAHHGRASVRPASFPFPWGSGTKPPVVS